MPSWCAATGRISRSSADQASPKRSARSCPNGVGALLDTASLGEKSFGAIRDGGIYIPVRSWGDKPAGRGIKIKPMMYPVSSNGIMVRERLRHEERHGRRTKGPELLSASRSTYRAKADGIRFRLRFGNPLLGRLPFGPGYQIPRKLESSQILLMGGTGCGKSTAIRQLLRQVQERGESAIVYDPAMDFVGEFYDPKRGDLIQHGHRNRESRTPNG